MLIVAYLLLVWAVLRAAVHTTSIAPDWLYAPPALAFCRRVRGWECRGWLGHGESALGVRLDLAQEFDYGRIWGNRLAADLLGLSASVSWTRLTKARRA